MLRDRELVTKIRQSSFAEFKKLLANDRHLLDRATRGDRMSDERLARAIGYRLILEEALAEIAVFRLSASLMAGMRWLARLDARRHARTIEIHELREGIKRSAAVLTAPTAGTERDCLELAPRIESRRPRVGSNIGDAVDKRELQRRRIREEQEQAIAATRRRLDAIRDSTPAPPVTETEPWWTTQPAPTISPSPSLWESGQSLPPTGGRSEVLDHAQCNAACNNPPIVVHPPIADASTRKAPATFRTHWGPAPGSPEDIAARQGAPHPVAASEGAGCEPRGPLTPMGVTLHATPASGTTTPLTTKAEVLSALEAGSINRSKAAFLIDQIDLDGPGRQLRGSR
jgi:hypothetical protein